MARRSCSSAPLMPEVGINRAACQLSSATLSPPDTTHPVHRTVPRTPLWSARIKRSLRPPHLHTSHRHQSAFRHLAAGHLGSPPGLPAAHLVGSRLPEPRGPPAASRPAAGHPPAPSQFLQPTGHFTAANHPSAAQRPITTPIAAASGAANPLPRHQRTGRRALVADPPTQRRPPPSHSRIRNQQPPFPVATNQPPPRSQTRLPSNDPHPATAASATANRPFAYCHQPPARPQTPPAQRRPHPATARQKPATALPCRPQPVTASGARTPTCPAMTLTQPQPLQKPPTALLCRDQPAPPQARPTQR